MSDKAHSPITTSAVQPVVPSGAPKQKNGWLIALLITLCVGGIAVIAGLIIYFTMFYISKSDYNTALAQTNTIITAYNSASTAADNYANAATDSTATDADLAKKATAYKTTYDTYTKSITTLASARAMKNAKVKAAYDQFMIKNTAFANYKQTMEQSMTTLHKVSVNCSESALSAMDTSDISQLTARYDTAVTPCTDALKELSGSKNVDAAKLAKDELAHFTTLRTHITAMQEAYTAGNRSSFDTEYNAFLNAASDTTAITDDIAGIQKHQESLSPTKELNNLAAVIQAQ